LLVSALLAPEQLVEEVIYYPMQPAQPPMQGPRTASQSPSVRSEMASYE
jgi:hypothetical protein